MGSALKLVIAGILSVTAAASWFAPVSAAPAQGETVYYKAGFSYGPVDDSVRSRIEGKSYRKNSNIALDELRYVRVLYCGFDGETKAGELIVNQEIAEDIVEIFYDLYQHPYPIQEISLIDKYDADDERSMRAKIHRPLIIGPFPGAVPFPNTLMVWRLTSIRGSIHMCGARKYSRKMAALTHRGIRESVRENTGSR